MNTITTSTSTTNGRPAECSYFHQPLLLAFLEDLVGEVDLRMCNVVLLDCGWCKDAVVRRFLTTGADLLERSVLRHRQAALHRMVRECAVRFTCFAQRF